MMFHSVNSKPIICKALITSLILLVIFSCKKGDTGPQGPAGPTGAQGPVGSPNVTYSEWFTPPAYTATTIFGIKNFDYTRSTPAITQAIIDSGMVLTYGKMSGYSTTIWPAGQVGQLPISLTYVQGGTQTDTWSAYDSVGKLRINFTNSVNYYSSISVAHSFRYIIIPGGAKVSGGGRHADYHSMSYGDVCDLLNIPR
ncbi:MULTISPECIES: collagen-like triple helix repeat-containing protein [Niastella]|uniref:Collagen-like protein n=1 Tax=Niastella soli TaxID=2821487 RepID=A0ABS3YL92_9BACT|nr:collagen-like protein [Niastella soli]MBO9198663.1 collagen-like protein [Niastella soli]